jgi:hypothetical protein
MTHNAARNYEAMVFHSECSAQRWQGPAVIEQDVECRSLGAFPVVPAYDRREWRDWDGLAGAGQGFLFVI